MNTETNTGTEKGEDLSFDELESMFGTPEDELTKMEQTTLTENLEGFASCFPDWDLHPPVSR